MNIKRLYMFALLLIAFFLLSACGGEPTAAPYTPAAPPPTIAPKPTVVIPGDAVAGKVVYDRECIQCHSPDSQVQIVGPSLYQAGLRFTLEYVKESIVHPDKPKEYESEAERPPLNAPKMPVDVIDKLTEKELEDVIAYVLSLK
ncbi:MAG: cytochrome c [Chloroflexota bacterium]